VRGWRLEAPRGRDGSIGPGDCQEVTMAFSGKVAKPLGRRYDGARVGAPNGRGRRAMTKLRFTNITPWVVYGLLTYGALATGVAEGIPDPRDTSLLPSARLAALLDHVRAAHQDLETLEADFLQLKESSMLFEPGRARGVFSYAAPDKVRWEYTDPDPISLLIVADRMTTWYRDLSHAEQAAVGGHSQRILEYMGASASLDRLLEYFSVSLQMPESPTAPFVLRLKPRFERVAKRIRELETWIDSERYVPVRLRYVEGDGDVTEYRFSQLRINQGLPESRFVLEIPDSVDMRVVRLEPLSGNK